MNYRTKNILLTCGIVSSLLYVATDLVSVMLWKEYRIADQTVRELFAIGAPTKPMVMMILFVVCGILAGLQQPQYAANVPTPFMGVWERINIYGYMLWLIVFAYLLIDESRLQVGSHKYANYRSN